MISVALACRQAMTLFPIRLVASQTPPLMRAPTRTTLIKAATLMRQAAPAHYRTRLTTKPTTPFPCVLPHVAPWATLSPGQSGARSVGAETASHTQPSDLFSRSLAKQRVVAMRPRFAATTAESPSSPLGTLQSTLNHLPLPPLAPSRPKAATRKLPQAVHSTASA